MNTDHLHTLRDYCCLKNVVDAKVATMIGIDCDGFDVNVDSKLLRFDFDEPVTSAAAARQALMTLAQQARIQ